MTLMQVWGCLLILTVSPIVGAVFCPADGDRLPRQKAEFWGFGLELCKGVGAVVLARFFFRETSPWELLALLALVMGRYWRRQDGVLTAVLGGLLYHDWQITILVGLIGIVGLTLFRQIRWGIWEILAFITFALVARHGGQQGYFLAAIALSGTLAWISSSQPKNREQWSLFQPGHSFRTLENLQTVAKVGQDAAILSQVKQWGYPVLPGWILEAGDDINALIRFLKPDGDRPYMVRLSSEIPSQRFHIPTEHLTSFPALESAIVSSFSPEALGKQALLVQIQPQILWSGITYSRPPLPYYYKQEPFSEVVQDLITPLVVGDGIFLQYYGLENPQPLKEASEPSPPPSVLIEAAQLSRKLEKQRGSPQAMEWGFDGQQLWILRVRPIYHLHPVWTREYIETVLPQPLRPLSASFMERIGTEAIARLHQAFLPSKQPLSQNAELLITHYQSYSYLNRTFWERILDQMDLNLRKLPKIREARLHSALTHPLLFYRYLRWDWSWQSQCRLEIKRHFAPTLKTVRVPTKNDLGNLSLEDLEEGLEQITEALSQLFDQFLRGELILRGRRSLLHVDTSNPPASKPMQELQAIATDIRNLNLQRQQGGDRHSRAALFAQLADMPDGESIFQQIDQWLAKYGHGADYPWELGQKRWQENAGSIRQRIADLLREPMTKGKPPVTQSWQERFLAQTIALQQEIQGLTDQFLAQFRWYLLAIAKHWQTQGVLSDKKDIFWLKFPEVLAHLHHGNTDDWEQLHLKIQYRRSQFALEREESPPPVIIYGQPNVKEAVSSNCALQKLQGQAASSGSVIGQVRLCPYWQQPPKLHEGEILVTPYLHENLFVSLPKLKGIITTKGGLLSQGASLARQRQLPMIIAVPNALERLRSGQWVRLDGRSGQVELLDADILSIGEG